MPARRRTRNPSPARKMIWARDVQTFPGITPTAPLRRNLLSPLEAALGSNLIGATVVRIRGVMAAIPTAGTTPSALVVGTLVAPSTTASTVPTPLTEPFADYMMWEAFLADADATGTGYGASDVTARMIDVKSARKIEEVGDVLYLTADRLFGDNTFNLLYSLSMLVKLP